MPLDDQTILAIEAAALKASLRAIDPYDKKVDSLLAKADHEERYKAADAKRAEEDRLRLAEDIASKAEAHAEEIAEKVANRIIASLGIDPGKPVDFIRAMERSKGFFETVDSVKRHGTLAVVAAIALAGLAAFSKGFLAWVRP